MDKSTAKKMIEENYGYEIRVVRVYDPTHLGTEVLIQTAGDCRYWVVRILENGSMVVVD